MSQPQNLAQQTHVRDRRLENKFFAYVSSDAVQPPESGISPAPGGREDDGSLWPSPQVSCRAAVGAGGCQRLFSIVTLFHWHPGLMWRTGR
jgi:hypothetical protein